MKISRLINLILLSIVLAGLLAPLPARAGGPASDPEPCRESYTVVRGDVLSKIAERCGLTLSACTARTGTAISGRL